ncbi:uncharacterized protein LOC144884774 [Branchiostoma floridae x Branchiostoma japonicum]
MDMCKANPWVYRALITEQMWSGEFNMVFQLIQNYPFGPSADLVQLWDEAHYRQVERSTGKPLTSVGKFRVRKRFPPPLSIAPHGRKMLTLPREAKKELQAWFLDHLDHPYPSRAEKYDLAKLTGLTVKQVSTWFQNTRRRLHQRQDTNWDKSPWMDLDITLLKRSQSSPDEEQYYKYCGVSSRVQEAGDCLIYTELQTVASLLTSDGTEDTKCYTWPTATDGSVPSYGLERLTLGDQPGTVAALYSTDIANIAASHGATDTDISVTVSDAHPGAIDRGIPAAAVPGAVHGATNTHIPAAVPKATNTGIPTDVHGATDIGISVSGAHPGAIDTDIPAAAVLGAVQGATDTVIPVNIAVPGATCPYMSPAFPGAVHDATGIVIPAAVHSATDTDFHIAVPGAEQPAITVETYLKRDPNELTSVACARLDLTSSCVESSGN